MGFSRLFGSEGDARVVFFLWLGDQVSSTRFPCWNSLPSSPTRTLTSPSFSQEPLPATIRDIPFESYCEKKPPRFCFFRGFCGLTNWIARPPWCAVPTPKDSPFLLPLQESFLSHFHLIYQCLFHRRTSDDFGSLPTFPTKQKAIGCLTLSLPPQYKSGS